MRNKVFCTIVLIIMISTTILIKYSYAQQINGKCGSAYWYIDEEGTLIIEGGKLTSSTGNQGPPKDYQWLNYKDQIKKVVVKKAVSVEDGFNYMFYNLTNCKEIRFEYLNAINVSTMRSVFEDCISLTYVDLSGITLTNYERKVDMSNLFKNAPLMDMIIGDKFILSLNYNNILPNGIWEKNPNTTPITKLTSSQILRQDGSMKGTYHRVASISNGLDVDEEVTYNVTLTQDYTYKVVSDSVVEHDGHFYIDVNKSTRPDRLVVTYIDGAITKDRKRYNVEITLTPSIIGQRVSTMQRYLEFYSTGSMHNYYCDAYFNRIKEPKNQKSAKLNCDVSIKIVDKEGNPQEGTFIFTAYDIDTPDKSNVFNSPYSEGFNIRNGVSSIKISNDSLLHIEQINEGTRIRGTAYDGGTEASMFIAITDAQNNSFTWTTDRDCGTRILTEYSPQLLQVKKNDSQGRPLPGAKLALFGHDSSGHEELRSEWLSDYVGENVWLTPGTYTLKELEPPLGYKTLEEPIIIFVESDGRMFVNEEQIEDSIELTNYLRDDIKYEVEYYLQDVDPMSEEILETYSLEESDTINGIFNSVVTAQVKSFDGYKVNYEIEGTKTEGVINLDEKLVLRLYYSKEYEPKKLNLPATGGKQMWLIISGITLIILSILIINKKIYRGVIK